jgi:hypothetical protein
LKPREKPLDLPSPLVAPELAPVLGLLLFPAVPVRSDHLDALPKQGLIQRVGGVVGFVSDQALGLLLQKAACQSRFNKGDFVRRSTLCVEGERNRRAV